MTHVNVKKLAKICGKLGDENEATRLVAATRAHELVKAAGANWADILTDPSTAAGFARARPKKNEEVAILMGLLGILLIIVFCVSMVVGVASFFAFIAALLTFHLSAAWSWFLSTIAAGACFGISWQIYNLVEARK